jgi:glycosyltransferase involved in cell wall biosynthesis
VLLVIAGLPAGGAERQMALLAHHLDRATFEPGLLIFGRRERIHYAQLVDDVPWFRSLELSHAVPRPLLPARLFGGLRRAVAEFRPDILHSSLNKANQALRATAMLSGWRSPIVTSVRNDFRHGYSRSEKWAERLLVHRSRRVIANSEAVRRQLIEDLSLSPERVVTVNNGIDPRFFGDTAAPPPEWWPSGRVALMVGRFSAQKDHLGLMRLLAGFEASGRLADWHFVLVGEGPLEAAIRAAAPPGRVTIRPPMDDLRPLYRAASVLLLPSRWEGMPNVALEAQASGCPVALTPAANAASVVDAGSGWILEEPVARSLDCVLATPAAEFRRMGSEARHGVVRRFSVEAMVTGTAAVYGDLLTRASNSG